MLNDTLDFSNLSIILNRVHPIPSHIVNMVVLLAKQYRYRTRCLGGNISSRALVGEVYNYHSYELYFAKTTGKLARHNKKWSPLINHVEASPQNIIVDEYINDYEQGL